MIQRIQTIWLLLASACVFLTNVFSSFVGTHSDGVAHFLKGTENTILVILTSMVGVVALIAMFLFKNRSLQIKIILVSLLLELVLIGLYVKEILTFEKGTYALAALLHVGVIVFLLFAIRGIKADEKLLKESSRLR